MPASMTQAEQLCDTAMKCWHYELVQMSENFYRLKEA